MPYPHSHVGGSAASFCILHDSAAGDDRTSEGPIRATSYQGRSRCGAAYRRPSET